jgi:hypothetical protein
MGWYEIYYSDGSIFDSTKDVSAPPPFNVQVIAHEDEDHEVYFDQGEDFYYWNGERWWGTGWEGMYQVLSEWGVWKPQIGTKHLILVDGGWVEVDIVGLIKFMVDSGKVLLGRAVLNSEYQAIYQKAKRNKQTFHPKERKP